MLGATSHESKLFGPEAACTVHVDHCGAPVTHPDATVVVYLEAPGDLLSTWQGPAEHEGNGEYVAWVPTNRKPSLDGEALRSAAQKIAWTLGQVCTVLSLSGDPEVYLAGFCPAIGAALTTVTGPGGVAIGVACAKVSVAVLAYCKTLGEGGVVGADRLAEQILQAVQDPMVLTGQVRLKADVWVPGLAGQGGATGPVSAPAAGPFPDLTIHVIDMSRIASLTLSPSSPAAGQGYTATAVIGCALVGDWATISMVGTDGYTQSEDFDVTTEGNQSFSITVPGAVEGVKDTVTVTLHRSNGTVETREAWLVFGGGGKAARRN
jgi:hypothetical protein